MPQHQPLTVPVSPEVAAALREGVAAGEYAIIEEAVADAVSAWLRRDETRAEDLAWVRAKIRTSLADPDPDLSEEELNERLRLMFQRADRQADEAA